jgi:hypothetical protein
MFDEFLASLELDVTDATLRAHERETSSGFSRTTTVVELHGPAGVGRGEDVTYEAADHERFRERGLDGFDLEGSYTIAAFSSHVGAQDLFSGGEPEQSVFRNYRRWAFESAALDLALTQAETDLATALDRSFDPVHFVVSTRLGDSPSADRVLAFLDRDPTLEFKLDPTSEWKSDLVDRLAQTDAVRTLDLKGQYSGTEVDQPADPVLYELVLEGFPDALVEDPALTDETRTIVEPHVERVAWDYPITGLDSIRELPWEPHWINIKPSRFGSIESLFETIAYCLERDIQLYGGGQFELGVGRSHLHALASLFYPDAPNDVAPRGYNDPEPGVDLPGSPLVPVDEQVGLGWSFRE